MNRNYLYFTWAAVAACATATLFAADPKTAYLDPKDAGADFQVQGEYVGEIPSNNGGIKMGVQVIALGDGKFRAVAYRRGLPGAGWNGTDKYELEGETKEGETIFQGENGRGVIKDGKLRIEATNGNTLVTLKKTTRKSATLGKKPPEDAVVLFDGTTAEHFKGGKLTEDGLLEQGVTSKQTFGDCTLHMEFLLSFMPYARAQGRSNSGVYLQGRYEVQILDSFGLAGKNNECGGIYEIRDPDVNMCLPPLSWQTYDIDFTAPRFDGEGNKISNAKMTVRHNGVEIHRDVEVPRTTRAAPAKEGPEDGPIYIQDHGNPIRFRNIWVLPKTAESE